ncbi:MAG: DUF3570 domain-containing protein [bacterium]
MQLRTLLSAATAVLLGAPGVSPAVDDQEARVSFEYFADSDHVHVYSTGGNYGIDFDPETSLSMTWNHELVVVPGIAAPAGSAEALDAISGASRPIGATSDPYADFTKTRDQLDATAAWRWFSAGYYVSNETDYFAQQIHGGVRRSLRDDNTILQGTASYGWDAIEPSEDEDTNTAADHKKSLHAAIVVTQVLTPVTLIQGGAEVTRVEGLQHNPYRTVYVAGAYEAELHPDTRLRQDIYLKVNQSLPNRASAKLDYKFYSDDWGITSHTLGGKLNQYVGSDVVVRYRYRYYLQTAADFWREEYTEPGGVDGYRTVDYRMGDFSAHLFGAKLSWDLSENSLTSRWFRGTSFELQYERYFNSNNFSANIFETGLAFAF